MNYKVYNTDTNNWMTYRKDGNGRYEVVREGLPRIKGAYYTYVGENYDEAEYQVTDYDIYVPIYKKPKVVEVPRCRPCTRRCIFRKSPKPTCRYTYISL
jgi:hypothetical protein